MDKQRLFIDMDGTLAEWRNIKFSADITKPEDIAEAINKLNEILILPGYYISLTPHQNVVDMANKLIEEDELDIYIITCVMNPDDPKGPAYEKREWNKKEIPGLKDDHVIIVPNGEDKTKYIPGGMRKGDMLLDDYTKNLKDFERAGGWGIKLLNDINEKNGSWVGCAISMYKKPDVLVDSIKTIARGERIRHQSPQKNREDVYIEITKDFILPNNFPVAEAEEDYTR